MTGSRASKALPILIRRFSALIDDTSTLNQYLSHESGLGLSYEWLSHGLSLPIENSRLYPTDSCWYLMTSSLMIHQLHYKVIDNKNGTRISIGMSQFYGIYSKKGSCHHSVNYSIILLFYYSTGCLKINFTAFLVYKILKNEDRDMIFIDYWGSTNAPSIFIVLNVNTCMFNNCHELLLEIRDCWSLLSFGNKEYFFFDGLFQFL